MMKSYLFLEKI